MPMRLVADRFVVDEQGAAIDLATGARVQLDIATRGAAAETERWAIRCRWFATLHHRFIAPLLDYGPLGEVHRFEAWACEKDWSGSPDAGAQARERAQAFLRACGLSIEAVGDARLGTLDSRPVVVPGAAAGYECSEAATDEEIAALPLDALGIVVAPSHDARDLNDAFEERRGGRSLILALGGETDAHLAVSCRQLARSARLSGFVPVAARAVEMFASLLSGRSVCLWIDARVADRWRPWLTLHLQSRRPHVGVFVGAHATPAIRDALRSAIRSEALAKAVWPQRLTEKQRVAAVRAWSQGGRSMPLRDSLWGTYRMPDADDRSKSPRVAESVATYGQTADREPEARRVMAWPAQAELAALRQRMADAVVSVRRGHHARADRALRQVGPFFARRGDWHHAAEAAIVLAESLLKRGRIREAQAVLDEAKSAAERTADARVLLQVTILSGVAATERASLDEAETLLAATIPAAEGLKESASEYAAREALARCLFWRGRFAEGERALATIDTQRLADGDAVRLAAERSRLAVGRGDFETAVSVAAAGLLRAERSGEAGWTAVAARAAALVYLNIGDPASTGVHVARCVAAARAAHDPLLALRARLIGAENDRRQGRRAPAVALVRRLQRVGRSRLPPLLAARTDLIAELLADAARVDIASHVRATGLGGLALYAPARGPRCAKGPLVEDLVTILQCCHAAEEESGVLAALCASLRSRLHAAAVGFFLDARGGPVPVATDGGRIESTLAARVLAIDQVIAPSDAAGRTEAGVPIRYGTKRLGALVARWTLASPIAAADAVLLLSTAAVAAAPACAGLAAGRQAPAVRITSDLLGTSDAMESVRRAVERAAPAPFAVLVEGESGSGKELVARALHRPEPAPRPAVLHAQLRGAAGRSRGVGALRTLARRIYRRGRGAARASSRRRTPARSFSTKSASCHRARRPRSCAASRKARCAGSAKTSRAASTSA